MRKLSIVVALGLLASGAWAQVEPPDFDETGVPPVGLDQVENVEVLVPDTWLFPVSVPNGDYWEPWTDFFGDGTAAVVAGTYEEGEIPETMTAKVAFIDTEGNVEEYWAWYGDNGEPYTGNMNIFRVTGNPPRMACDRRPGGTNNYIVGQEASPWMFDEFYTDSRWEEPFLYNERASVVQLFHKGPDGPEPITNAIEALYMNSGTEGVQDGHMRWGGEIRFLSDGNIVVAPEDRNNATVAGTSVVFAIMNGQTGEHIAGPLNGRGDGAAASIWSNVAAFNGGFCIRAEALMTIFDNDGTQRYFFDQEMFTSCTERGRSDGHRIGASIASDYVYLGGNGLDNVELLARFDAVNSTADAIAGQKEVAVTSFDFFVEGGAHDRTDIGVDDSNNVVIAWDEIFSSGEPQIVARIYNSDMEPVTPIFYAYEAHDAWDGSDFQGFTGDEVNVAMDNQRILIASNGIIVDPAGGLTPAEQTTCVVYKNPFAPAPVSDWELH